MKTTPIVLASLLVIMAVSCKDKAAETETTTTETEVIAPEAPPVPDPQNTDTKVSQKENAISSSAASIKNDGGKKVIRTAAIKFRAKDVSKSTYAIENAVNYFGGSVSYTNLQSTVLDKKETQISQDSTLEITKYTVENNITIRVPNTKLDTVIKIIAKQIDFLDSRVIKADDIALKMLANEMVQNRTGNYQKRLEKGIDTKGRKLTDVVTAEDELLNKKEQSDNTIIDNLSMQDKVRFSTLTLELYQRETVKSELIASPIGSNSYHPNIGFQLVESLKTGWFMLEGVVAFIVQLWFLILMGVGGIILYKRYFRSKLEV